MTTTQENVSLKLSPELATSLVEMLRFILWVGGDFIVAKAMTADYDVAELEAALGAQWEPAVR